MQKRERFDSFNLMKSFSRRFQNRTDGSSFKRSGDDALCLIRRNSDFFEHLFDSIYLIGSFPWESENDQNRILFKFPQNKKKSESKSSSEPDLKRQTKPNEPSSKSSNDNNIDKDCLTNEKKNIENNTEEDEEDSISEAFVRFCMPENSNSKNHLFLSELLAKESENSKNRRKVSFQKDDFVIKSHLIADENISKAAFYPLFFPTEVDTSPYIFCLSFYCSVFNFPSFGHNFSLEEMVSHHKSDNSDIMLSKLCLCVKTSFPFHLLFKSFLEWILRCEIVGRVELFQSVSDYFENGNDVNYLKGLIWPEPQKKLLIELIEDFSILPTPYPNEVITIDKKPFPNFSWKRPDDSITLFPIAKWASMQLLATLDYELFCKLFFCVLLEKTVIIYNSNIAVTSWIVLALHFMIRPLKWVSVSVSLLPEDLLELLDAPNPMIVGVTVDLSKNDFFNNVPLSNTIYFDSTNHTILAFSNSNNGNKKITPGNESTCINSYCFLNSNNNGNGGNNNFSNIGRNMSCNNEWLKEFLPPAPQESIFIEDIAKCWKSPTCFVSVLTIANHFVSTILKVVDSSIMTNISDLENTSSIFMEEIFLRNFPEVERKFLKALTATQMFQFFVEQKCRMRSERKKMK